MTLAKKTLERILEIFRCPTNTIKLKPGAMINPKEKQAFALTLEGKQVKDIARIMRVVPNTAGSYVKGITRKTGLRKADFGPHIFNQICMIIADHEVELMKLDKDPIMADIADTIKVQGPHRVIINKEGAGISYQLALARNIIPTVIFIRADGWSLGAPDHLIEVARAIWPKGWKAVLYVATGIVVPYGDWTQAYKS